MFRLVARVGIVRPEMKRARCPFHQDACLWMVVALIQTAQVNLTRWIP
ncbi:MULTISPECIES: hypothetical protein [unclassified Moorena]|nr:MULTISPECIES: hypothetical protein [unclassified Moorena]NEO09187.1 hypothetical protein [Moorena sp. SIO3I8]NEP23001.1 hypothetical protein [Moorena sp. SIO3I6]